MRARLASTLLAAPLAGVLVWVGGPVLAVVAAIMAFWGLREARLLLRAGGERPGAIVPEVLGLGLLFAVGFGAERFWPLFLLLALAAGLFGRAETAFLAARANLFLSLYPAGFLGFLLLLRAEHGPALTLVALGGVWANDIAAFLVGRSYGRRRLTEVSPGKSWEGTAAGLFGSEAVWLAGAGWLGLPFFEAALLGLATFVGALAGDLLESALKRWAGAKDSGSFLPGHGGILDRLDSVLLALPLVYYLVTAFGR